ncbi:MAG: hypothetical protein FWE58_02670 [Methanobrevibacter sp.]|nr:hypothetical protein [Methanobrevibacter sp.]
MAKSFDIIMAGLISGLVALTTSYLGIAGTIIGAVTGAILYQIFSIFIKEPLENTTIRKVENEIVYIIPLILIAILLMIFIIAVIIYYYQFYWPDFSMIFLELRELTNNNLVRIMGISLMIMGLYPIFQGKIIKKEYGIVNLILGFLLLLRGLIDIFPEFFDLYVTQFSLFDMLLLIGIFLVLSYVILRIFLESITAYMGRNKEVDGNEINDSGNNTNNLNDIKSIKADKTSTMSKNTSFFKKIDKK